MMMLGFSTARAAQDVSIRMSNAVIFDAVITFNCDSLNRWECVATRWEFIFDRATTGHSLKWLSIVEVYSRRCITPDAGRSMTSEDVINRLAELFVIQSVPECIRSDKVPEFIAKAIPQWLTSLDVTTLHVEADSPWQNGFGESFHSRLRDERLYMEEFDSERHARAHAAT